MHTFQTSLVALVFLLASGFAFSDDKPKTTKLDRRQTTGSPAFRRSRRSISTSMRSLKTRCGTSLRRTGSSMLPQAIRSRDGTMTPSAHFSSARSRSLLPSASGWNFAPTSRPAMPIPRICRENKH